MAQFAIKVIWSDGDEEFVCTGTSHSTAKFSSMQEAKEMRDFMKVGMEGECQSINIVPYQEADSHVRRIIYDKLKQQLG